MATIFNVTPHFLLTLSPWKLPFTSQLKLFGCFWNLHWYNPASVFLWLAYVAGTTELPCFQGWIIVHRMHILHFLDPSTFRTFRLPPYLAIANSATTIKRVLVSPGRSWPIILDEQKPRNRKYFKRIQSTYEKFMDQFLFTKKYFLKYKDSFLPFPLNLVLKSYQQQLKTIKK